MARLEEVLDRALHDFVGLPGVVPVEPDGDGPLLDGDEEPLVEPGDDALDRILVVVLGPRGQRRGRVPGRSGVSARVGHARQQPGPSGERDEVVAPVDDLPRRARREVHVDRPHDGRRRLLALRQDPRLDAVGRRVRADNEVSARGEEASHEGEGGEELPPPDGIEGEARPVRGRRAARERLVALPCLRVERRLPIAHASALLLAREDVAPDRGVPPFKLIQCADGTHPFPRGVDVPAGDNWGWGPTFGG